LDAPGLDIVVNYITELDDHLNKPAPDRAKDFPAINQRASYQTEWFTAFILSQYKTATRNDTAFWQDQKAVQCEWYENIINNIDNLDRVHNNNNMMFYSTVAGKDRQWNISDDLASTPLVPIRERVLPTLHHVDFLEQMRENPLVAI